MGKRKKKCTEAASPDLAVQVELRFYGIHLKPAKVCGHLSLPSQYSTALIPGKFFRTESFFVCMENFSHSESYQNQKRVSKIGLSLLKTEESKNINHHFRWWQFHLVGTIKYPHRKLAIKILFHIIAWNGDKTHCLLSGQQDFVDKQYFNKGSLTQ